MDAHTEQLQRYLDRRRVAVLAKIDGLSEYDIRRPLTPTGTNLLGLLKHLALVQLGYFGPVFGRPSDRDPGIDPADPDADMWATPEETREDIVALFRHSAEHADATIAALDADAPGHVPWWGERGDTTLHAILVHVLSEFAQHGGHADIVRELIDGRVGDRPGDPNIPHSDAEDWERLHDRILDAARAADPEGSAAR